MALEINFRDTDQSSSVHFLGEMSQQGWQLAV